MFLSVFGFRSSRVVWFVYRRFREYWVGISRRIVRTDIRVYRKDMGKGITGLFFGLDVGINFLEK